MSDVTKTISVTTATHAELVRRGRKGQSFDEIIQELLTKNKEATA